MLQKRTPLQFILLRLKRLLVPLLFGMLLLVPIQVYMERINTGCKESFWLFYPSIFTTGTYPKGNLGWHHLWFIAYLFSYDVLLAHCFKWLQQNTSKRHFLQRLTIGKRIYLLMVPSVVYFSATVLRFPETHALVDDWCWAVYWLLFLLAGFVCMCVPDLLDSLERNRRFSLQLALTAVLILNYLRWNELEPAKQLADRQYNIGMYLYLALYPVVAWLWLFAAVGYGKRYLNRKWVHMDYINGAVYPFYILHQTVIVVLAYYVVKTADDILTKYLFTAFTALLISMLLYHLFVRPFGTMRFLFGAKAAEKKKAGIPPAATKVLYPAYLNNSE